MTNLKNASLAELRRRARALPATLDAHIRTRAPLPGTTHAPTVPELHAYYAIQRDEIASAIAEREARNAAKARERAARKHAVLYKKPRIKTEKREWLVEHQAREITRLRAEIKRLEALLESYRNKNDNK